MTVVILAGVLTFVVGLLILRPLPGKAGRPQVQGHDPDDDQGQALFQKQFLKKRSISGSSSSFTPNSCLTVTEPPLPPGWERFPAIISNTFLKKEF